jgi:hypothetical protein
LRKPIGGDIYMRMTVLYGELTTRLSKTLVRTLRKSGDGCHEEKKARDIVGGENLVHESEREKIVIK